MPTHTDCTNRFNKFVSFASDFCAAVLMNLEVGLKCTVLLEQALHGGQRVAAVVARQQVLLLHDPCLLFLDARGKLLVGQRLVQPLATLGGLLSQLIPVLGQLLEPVLDLVSQ